jgi:tetratricopeptide (TPR) repeat protein
LRAEEILENTDSFWETDGAYNLVGKWHRNINIPIPHEKWEKKMSEISETPAEKRETQTPILVTREILSNKEKYLSEGIPFVCSFLPKGTTNLDTKVYFTAETMARSFMTHSNIVVNVTATYWNNEAGIILNNLVHELFHIGYGLNRFHRSEIELDNDQLYSVIDALQNEGIATYVGYKGLSIFPTEIEKDYQLLESETDFKRLLSELNNLFSHAESLSPDSLRTKAWDVGVVQRAYYIVGAIMAKTVDEKKGREALVNTIKVGPRNFISSYNSVVEEDKKIFEFKLPENLSITQKLKQAYLKGNQDEARLLREELISNKDRVDPSLENKINSLGYRMLNQKRYEDAIDLLTLNVTLFPSSSNTYDSLGEAFLKKGNKELALRNYKKALELDPDNSNVRSMIEELEWE